MIHIKRFIDKVSSMEGRQGRDVVMTSSDARALRDEIAKLVIDRYEQTPTATSQDEVINVELKGSKW
jgi:hypothetical protein